MRGRAFVDFIKDLFAGDPVALTFTGVVLGIVVLLLLFWLKTNRDRKKAEEERQRKRKKADKAADAVYQRMKGRRDGKD